MQCKTSVPRLAIAGTCAAALTLFAPIALSQAEI